MNPTPISLGPIGLAGAGRLAQALGRLLRERGEPVVAIASRDPVHASAGAAFIGGVEAVSYAELPGRASRILICVADEAITTVASILADAGMRTGAALHTCGALGAKALSPLAEAGVSCGTLHPLQTIPTPERGLEALLGISFAIDGSGLAAAWAERIAELLGGHVLRISPAARPVYHAAAVLAGNGAIGLLDAAVILMGSAGVEEEDALRALGPLVRTSIDNSLAIGPRDALTGPASRGDARTIAAHWQASAEAPETVRSLYRAVSLRLLEMARRRGLSEELARSVEIVLERKNG